MSYQPSVTDLEAGLPIDFVSRVDRAAQTFLSMNAFASAAAALLRNEAQLQAFDNVVAARQSAFHGAFMEDQTNSLADIFENKAVVSLSCKSCHQVICRRGMHSSLLADNSVQLYSTDVPPKATADLIGKDYNTGRCACKVRDVGCLCCGNVIGYHVSQPCRGCLRAQHNGHFWMFQATAVEAAERRNSVTGSILLWRDLMAATSAAAAAHSRDSSSTMESDACPDIQDLQSSPTSQADELVLRIGSRSFDITDSGNRTDPHSDDAILRPKEDDLQDNPSSEQLMDESTDSLTHLHTMARRKSRNNFSGSNIDMSQMFR